MVQTMIVLLIVLAAAAYVGRRAWLALRPKKDAGCAADCGCATNDAAASDWAKT